MTKKVCRCDHEPKVCSCVMEDGEEIYSVKDSYAVIDTRNLIKAIVNNATDAELLQFVKDLSVAAESAALDLQLYRYFRDLMREES